MSAERMRVLHVYSGNRYGGIETLLVTLARDRLLVPSLDAEYALCFPGRLSRDLSAAGAPVHDLGAVRISRPTTVLRARRALARLLAARPFDVVVCHGGWSHAIFGPVVRAARRALVVWAHAAGDGRHWLDRWARGTPPDLVICNSRYTERAASSLHPGVPTEVVYCGVPAAPPVDRADRGSVRTALDTADDAVVVVQVSRLERLKGQTVHLEALSRLGDVPGWVCWQVGGAQTAPEQIYADELVEDARRLGIAARVRFLGERSDVPRLLAAADIYCQPNIGPETFGIAFVEALHAGLPVVTTTIGAAAEVVDASCGVLVPPHDAGALAATLRRLIGDAALRQRLGAAGPARARALCDPLTRLTAFDRALASVARHDG